MPKTRRRNKKRTKFTDGSKIVEEAGEFTAYDNKGNYLGFVADETVATRMAQSGRIGVATADVANPLALWAFWNDAVDGGARVMLSDDGYQIVAMTDSIFVRAKDDKHGWDVDVITDVELGERYWDEVYQAFRLTVVASGNKLRLE